MRSAPLRRRYALGCILAPLSLAIALLGCGTPTVARHLDDTTPSTFFGEQGCFYPMQLGGVETVRSGATSNADVARRVASAYDRAVPRRHEDIQIELLECQSRGYHVHATLSAADVEAPGSASAKIRILTRLGRTLAEIDVNVQLKGGGATTLDRRIELLGAAIAKELGAFLAERSRRDGRRLACEKCSANCSLRLLGEGGCAYSDDGTVGSAVVPPRETHVEGHPDFHVDDPPKPAATTSAPSPQPKVPVFDEQCTWVPVDTRAMAESNCKDIVSGRIDWSCVERARQSLQNSVGGQTMRQCVRVCVANCK